MGSSVAYSVTKAAGLQLMKNLAFSQGPKIRVNAVLPGLLMTEWVPNCLTYSLFWEFR
jgi:NAD(P)-dependent dehydrogenase (short-subunit alcohol dehydrogenase family)